MHDQARLGSSSDPPRARGSMCSTEKDEFEQSEGLLQYSQSSLARNETRFRTLGDCLQSGIAIPARKRCIGDPQLRANRPQAYAA